MSLFYQSPKTVVSYRIILVCTNLTRICKTDRTRNSVFEMLPTIDLFFKFHIKSKAVGRLPTFLFLFLIFI